MLKGEYKDLMIVKPQQTTNRQLKKYNQKCYFKFVFFLVLLPHVRFGYWPLLTDHKDQCSLWIPRFNSRLNFKRKYV